MKSQKSVLIATFASLSITTFAVFADGAGNASRPPQAAPITQMASADTGMPEHCTR